MGDINPFRHFYAPNLSFGVMYRQNFNSRNALRFSMVYSSLEARDSDFDDSFQQARNAGFSNTFLDCGLQFEFNFLPYVQPKGRKQNITPYIAAGIGYNMILSSSASSIKSMFKIPFGGGVKFNIVDRLGAGAEWMFNRTFSDGLDGVENFTNPEIDTGIHNKDWHSLVGIFVTYKIFKITEDCPAYD